MASVILDLIKNRSINNILKTIFMEKNTGKPGVTISELSEKTGIERHKLAGIIEVLVVLGIVVIFNMGMMKIVAPTETMLKMKEVIANFN